jgi:hypothetical protein
MRQRTIKASIHDAMAQPQGDNPCNRQHYGRGMVPADPAANE